MAPSALRARKQQRARDEIVAAAYELFAERGYAAVTVADIAARADVGRTTFFRYFGDKQEVVFANEQRWLDNVGRRHRASSLDGPLTFHDALTLVRETVVAICAEATRDAARYIQRERLIDENPELGDRAARKQRRFAEMMSEILRTQGASAETAALVPHLALACYNAGRQVAAGDPAALGPSVEAAFGELDIASPQDRQASGDS